MFRAMFPPIIRSTWLYLQYLVVFTQVAAGWCPEWVETELCRLWGVRLTVYIVQFQLNARLTVYIYTIHRGRDGTPFDQFHGSS
jgi:hypothetical protein